MSQLAGGHARAARRTSAVLALVGALSFGLHHIEAQSLPAGWSSLGVGGPVVAGSASGSGSSFTVTGAGTDIGGQSNQFQFLYQAATGALDVRVRVATLQNVNPGAKAGLMIRENLTGRAAVGVHLHVPWRRRCLPGAHEQRALEQRNQRSPHRCAGVAASSPPGQPVQQLHIG